MVDFERAQIGLAFESYIDVSKQTTCGNCRAFFSFCHPEEFLLVG